MANIIDQPGVVHSASRTWFTQGGVEQGGGYSQYFYGTGPDSYDGDYSTYYGISQLASGEGHEWGVCSATVDHTWTTPTTLGEFSAKIYGQSNAYSGNYANRGVQPQIYHSIKFRMGGVWTEVWSYTDPYYGGDSQPSEEHTSTPTVTGTWNNVTGIRVYSYACSYTYEGARTSRTWAFIYDVSAAPANLDATVQPDTLEMNGTAWGTFTANIVVELSDPLILTSLRYDPVLPYKLDLSLTDWIAADVYSVEYVTDPQLDPLDNRFMAIIFEDEGGESGFVWSRNIEIRTADVWETHLMRICDIEPYNRDTIVEMRVALSWGAYLYEPWTVYLNNVRSIVVHAVDFNRVACPSNALNPWGEATYLDLQGDLNVLQPSLSISSTEIVESPIEITGRILDNTFNNARFYADTLELGIYALAPGDALVHPDDVPLEIVLIWDEEVWRQLTSLDLALTVNEPETEVGPDYSSSFALALTLHSPYAYPTHFVRPQTLQLNAISASGVPNSPLHVDIVRYIKDPVTTGGCPQCGTFLYKEYGARQLDSDDVFTGRNFSIRGEDKFYFCARCNFPVKVKRHPSMRKGSYAGWGMKYDEIKAGEE